MPEAVAVTDLDALAGALPPQHGFPHDWYWRKQDGTLFSSARIQTVPASDEQYREWAGEDREPSDYSRDADGNDSVVEMQWTLDTHDLHATLEHYAGGLRYSKVQEPILVPVGGKSYRFQTDEESTAKLSASVQLGEQYEAVNGEGSFAVPWKTADGFTDAPLSLADLKSVGLAIGMNEATWFAKEAAADAGLASGNLKTKADVETVFAAPVATVPAKAPRKSTAKTTS